MNDIEVDDVEDGQPAQRVPMTDETDGTLVSIANILLSRRLSIIVIAVSMTVLALLYGLFFAGYTAHATFTASTSEVSTSTISQLAAQFGISGNLMGAMTSGSPSIYAELIQSDELLTTVANSHYHIRQGEASIDTVAGTYVDLTDTWGDSPAERIQNAVDRLKDHKVSVDQDIQSGVITVTVRAEWPDLAEQVAHRIVALVDSFNVNELQTAGRNERKFLKRRVGQARAELESTEDTMRVFLEKNRTYQSSPRLVFEQARIQRHVDLMSVLYTSLAQSYEQARLQAVRDVPVITVIDAANQTARVRFKLSLLLIVGSAFGVVLGIGVALISEYLTRARDEGRVDVLEFYERLSNHGARIRDDD